MLSLLLIPLQHQIENSGDGGEGGTSAAGPGLSCMARAVELCKAVAFRLWPDHPLAALRQLPELGRSSASAASLAAGAGITSLNDIVDRAEAPARIESVSVSAFSRHCFL